MKHGNETSTIRVDVSINTFIYSGFPIANYVWLLEGNRGVTRSTNQ